MPFVVHNTSNIAKLLLARLGTDSRFVVTGSSLMIDPVMLSDDESYTCEANNIAGTIRSVAYLNVQCKYQSYW